MKALHDSRARFISGLVLSGSLALLALQPLAAQAGTGPGITASVQSNASVVQVYGYGFGLGDRIKVVETANGHVIGKVITTATRYVILTQPCNSCLITQVKGGFNVTMPPQFVHCDYLNVTVRAYDTTNRTHSNAVQVRLGNGPC